MLDLCRKVKVMEMLKLRWMSAHIYLRNRIRNKEINLKVLSDRDTNRLIAKFYGAKPVQMFWSDAEKANVGKLKIPNDLASGKYVLSVSAEDFAHNHTTEEIQIEVMEK